MPTNAEMADTIKALRAQLAETESAAFMAEDRANQAEITAREYCGLLEQIGEALGDDVKANDEGEPTDTVNVGLVADLAVAAIGVNRSMMSDMIESGDLVESNELNVEIVDSDPPAEAAKVYVWDIPADSMPGYSLRIEVEGADTVDEARAVALGYRVSIGPTPDDVRPLGRGEANWIQTVEPAVARDREDISCDLDEQIRRNDELEAKFNAYRECEETFDALGIDVHNPDQWVGDRIADTAQMIATADADRDKRHKSLVAALLGLQGSLQSVIEETGFAPVREPDTSVAREAHDRAVGALETALAAYRNADLSDVEAAGWRDLSRPGGVLDDLVRTQPGAEREATMRAITDRIRALMAAYEK